MASDLNGEKFATEKVEVRWKKSKSVEILDESLVPEEYKTFKTVESISKTAIKKAIDKEGLDIPGARLLINNNMRVI